MDPKSTAAPKPLRADAERNRRAIIDAAERVFATEGTSVTLEHVADVAGVGVGTIYRRFASLADLVTVVMEAKISRYADRSEEAAAQAISQPWQAFEGHVMFMLEQQATDLAFSELILSPRGATSLFRSEIGRALDASIVLVERVKTAGMLRPAFDHSDLYMLLNANAGVVRGMGATAPSTWRRFGDYMLQAFRHDGERPLTPPSPQWTRASAARAAAHPTFDRD
ncbi:TetR family transcriptional regulator [Microbacterium excoecariae]|uniref:TetR family transcriptional regulator n=1 Tax=Microbacterium excoecariae TaxID=2715210 RepID=UPI0014088983|nr:TetR/AcrR family transcriptional regulator [Microbacterium excoecariae]